MYFRGLWQLCELQAPSKAHLCRPYIELPCTCRIELQRSIFLEPSILLGCVECRVLLYPAKGCDCIPSAATVYRL